MAQWKPLPDGLAPQVRALVVRLRELKDQVGLSTAALARKTASSKSSWERYLNGATLPPRQAVEALGQLSGADLARLLALWELAERAQVQRGPVRDTKPAADAADAADAVSGFWQRRRIVAAAAGVVGVAALGLTVWLTVWLTGRGPSVSQPSSAAKVSSQPTTYTCDYTTRDGRVYAGHSTTSQRLVMLDAGGEDVVEVQCLLVRQGFDPGRIDGLFGEHTEQAVKQLQSARGIGVDGIVGEHTWAMLRA